MTKRSKLRSGAYFQNYYLELQNFRCELLVLGNMYVVIRFNTQQTQRKMYVVCYRLDFVTLSELINDLV